MYYISMRKHHEEDNSVRGRISKEYNSIGGEHPRESSVKGSNLYEKLPFSLM
jgi:hypothetical protein